MTDSHRVEFRCNGEPVSVDSAPGESLLSVLRERLGLRSAKDGCAPQGQCGCCTVLIDGAARVACVTPATRVEGRDVTTVEGLAPQRRDELTAAFVATGASQCGFCTPGILMRASALYDRGAIEPPAVARALAAHLCRCTGWRTVIDAIGAPPPTSTPRRLDDAARRATLEGGVPQRVGPDVPLGSGGFADDLAPDGTLVAVPLPSGSDAAAVDAVGMQWVVAETLHEARRRAGKVQGRRTTRDDDVPLRRPPRPDGGVSLTTSWVEPAYLEPDASWCEPGGTPASPLANGGAFGAKTESAAPAAARVLADHLGSAVRVVYSREDVVRLGPKRPPIAAAAHVGGRSLHIAGAYVGTSRRWDPDPPVSDLTIEEHWEPLSRPGPPTSSAIRAFPLAERTVLREGAVTESGLDRAALCTDERVAATRLLTVAAAPGGALGGARVELDPVTGALVRVEVRVSAGDPLDDVVLRSYCVGAAHMALGWVLTETIAVDAASGDVLDLTIRSFGILRARSTPPIDVTVLDDQGAPRARAGDAVFAAVAAATWEAITAFEGTRPDTFPARSTATARAARA
jgi:aerobic-type carbon monoxide dehydrogenase small subunit (CoxS/CutS family)